MSRLCLDCRAVLPEAALQEHLDEFCSGRDIVCPICFDSMQAQRASAIARLTPYRAIAQVWEGAWLTCPGLRDLVATKTAEAFEAELQLTA